MFLKASDLSVVVLESESLSLTRTLAVGIREQGYAQNIGT